MNLCNSFVQRFSQLGGLRPLHACYDAGNRQRARR